MAARQEIAPDATAAVAKRLPGNPKENLGHNSDKSPAGSKIQPDSYRYYVLRFIISAGVF